MKSKSPKETIKFGEKIAKKNLKSNILALKGDLGGGKTTFLKGFAKGIGVKEEILSPTFIIFRKMQASDKRFFFHFDCYRIKEEKELLDLGFEEIVSDKNNIVALEWPEKVRGILPKNTVFIEFRHINENEREILWKN